MKRLSNKLTQITKTNELAQITELNTSTGDIDIVSMVKYSE